MGCASVATSVKRAARHQRNMHARHPHTSAHGAPGRLRRYHSASIRPWIVRKSARRAPSAPVASRCGHWMGAPTHAAVDRLTARVWWLFACAVVSDALPCWPFRKQVPGDIAWVHCRLRRRVFLPRRQFQPGRSPVPAGILLRQRHRHSLPAGFPRHPARVHVATGLHAVHRWHFRGRSWRHDVCAVPVTVLERSWGPSVLAGAADRCGCGPSSHGSRLQPG